MRLMGARATSALQAAIAAKALADAAEMAEDVLEFVKRNPYGYAFWLLAKISKFTANSVILRFPRSSYSACGIR